LQTADGFSRRHRRSNRLLGCCYPHRQQAGSHRQYRGQASLLVSQGVLWWEPACWRRAA